MTIRIPTSMARLAGLVLPMLGALAAEAGPPARDFEFRHENVLGTSMELRVRAETPAAAQAAEARVLAEIDRLAAILSGYDPASDFRRWQATIGQPQIVAPELYALLQASDRWREASGGAFDPRVQVLTELWARCARLDRRPTDHELAHVQAQMARPAWRLEPDGKTAEHLSDVPLSLNSIAKGDILGRAAEAARASDPAILGVLLNIGGDIRVIGEVERTVGITPPIGDSETAGPIAVVTVKNRSVATSGNYQRGFSIAGKWYSHIFDPRTGRPASGVLSSTVIADHAADANAIATTLNVLPVENGLRWVASIPGVECLIVTVDGHLHKSAGWSKYERPIRVTAAPARPRTTPAVAEPNASAWGQTHELRVNFELRGPEGNTRRRYQRPYVAVWVEDHDGLAARTLALWLQKRDPGPRWHPDLKRWYRDDQTRKLADDTDLIDTIARATRPPGKYTVTWDGKDDHGQPLAPGKYTICIEAAREHGTYQLIRKEITIGNTPFTADLGGNPEIKAASIDYHQK